MPRLIGRKGPKTPLVNSSSTPKGLAEEAVRKYEEELEHLEMMKADFKLHYPDAIKALSEIYQQADLVQSTVDAAHPLIQAAGETVGDFTCKRNYSSAKYNDDRFTRMVGQFDDGADILLALIKAGAVKKVMLDKSATSYMAQHPEMAEAFKDAWDEKKEKTAAVSRPKFSPNLI